MSAFVTLCEGFLGLRPHFDLWRYFFAVNIQKKSDRGWPELHMLMGCSSIQLQNNRAGDYLSMRLSTLLVFLNECRRIHKRMELPL
jgi:hypothetical protein